jgi:hypothetical protein
VNKLEYTVGIKKNKILLDDIISVYSQAIDNLFTGRCEYLYILTIDPDPDGAWSKATAASACFVPFLHLMMTVGAGHVFLDGEV